MTWEAFLEEVGLKGELGKRECLEQLDPRDLTGFENGRDLTESLGIEAQRPGFVEGRITPDVPPQAPPFPGRGNGNSGSH